MYTFFKNTHKQLWKEHKRFVFQTAKLNEGGAAEDKDKILTEQDVFKDFNLDGKTAEQVAKLDPMKLSREAAFKIDQKIAELKARKKLTPEKEIEATKAKIKIEAKAKELEKQIKEIQYQAQIKALDKLKEEGKYETITTDFVSKNYNEKKTGDVKKMYDSAVKMKKAYEKYNNATDLDAAKKTEFGVTAAVADLDAKIKSIDTQVEAYFTDGITELESSDQATIDVQKKELIKPEKPADTTESESVRLNNLYVANVSKARTETMIAREIYAKKLESINTDPLLPAAKKAEMRKKITDATKVLDEKVKVLDKKLEDTDKDGISADYKAKKLEIMQVTLNKVRAEAGAAKAELNSAIDKALEKHPELKCDKDKKPLDDKVARQNAMKFVPESVRAKYEKTTIKLTEEQRYFNAINKMKANKTGVPADLKMVEDLVEEEIKNQNPDKEGDGKIDKKDPLYARMKEKYIDSFQINASTPDTNGEKAYPLHEDKEAKSAQDAAEKAQKKLPKKLQESDTAKSDKWENPTLKALNASATDHWNKAVQAREAKKFDVATKEFRLSELDYTHMAEVDKTSEKAAEDAFKAADEAWKKVPEIYRKHPDGEWDSDEYSNRVRSKADTHWTNAKEAMGVKDTSTAVKEYKLAEEGYKKLTAMEKPYQDTKKSDEAATKAFKDLPDNVQIKDTTALDPNGVHTKILTEGHKHYEKASEAINNGDYVLATKEYKLAEAEYKKLKEISSETPKKKEAMDAQTKTTALAKKLYGESMATDTDNWDQTTQRFKAYAEATRHNNEASKAFGNYDYEKATKEYKLAETEYKKLEALNTVPKEVMDAKKGYETALGGVSAAWQGDPSDWDKNEAYTIVAWDAWEHKTKAETATSQQDYPKAAAEYKLAADGYKKLKPLADDWDKKNAATAGAEKPKEKTAEEKEAEAKKPADDAKTAMDQAFAGLKEDWKATEATDFTQWSPESAAIAKSALAKKKEAETKYAAKDYAGAEASYKEATAQWQALVDRQQKVAAEDEAAKKEKETGAAGGSGAGGAAGSSPEGTPGKGDSGGSAGGPSEATAGTAGASGSPDKGTGGGGSGNGGGGGGGAPESAGDKARKGISDAAETVAKGATGVKKTLGGIGETISKAYDSIGKKGNPPGAETGKTEAAVEATKEKDLPELLGAANAALNQGIINPNYKKNPDIVRTTVESFWTTLKPAEKAKLNGQSIKAYDGDTYEKTIDDGKNTKILETGKDCTVTFGEKGVKIEYSIHIPADTTKRPEYNVEGAKPEMLAAYNQTIGLYNQLDPAWRPMSEEVVKGWSEGKNIRKAGRQAFEAMTAAETALKAGDEKTFKDKNDFAQTNIKYLLVEQKNQTETDKKNLEASADNIFKFNSNKTPEEIRMALDEFNQRITPQKRLMLQGKTIEWSNYTGKIYTITFNGVSVDLTEKSDETPKYKAIQKAQGILSAAVAEYEKTPLTERITSDQTAKVLRAIIFGSFTSAINSLTAEEKKLLNGVKISKSYGAFGTVAIEFTNETGAFKLYR